MDDITPETPPPGDQGAGPCRLVVVGATLRTLLAGPGGIGNYAHVVREFGNWEEWGACQDTVEADLLVTHLPTLFPETVEQIQERLRATGAVRAVVVYEFAQEETLRQIGSGDSPITLLRGPVTAAALKEACEADIALATIRQQWTEALPEPAPTKRPIPDLGGGEIPPRQFDDRQLAKLSQISTAIDCECPHHLSALLVSLNAFEEYSARCENRNEEDAVLHAYLHSNTARARAIIEDALSVLAETEGFDLG